jgi:hypothetical protein
MAAKSGRPPAFHERFNIEIGSEEARRRFVNRAHNMIFEDFLQQFSIGDYNRIQLQKIVMNHLGLRCSEDGYDTLTDQVGRNFHANLLAIEGLYGGVLLILGKEFADQLEQIVRGLLYQAEVDLGAVWTDGCFIKTGARLLDERVVNDVLDWLRRPGFETVLKPFEKGLAHLLQGEKDPTRLSDAITDAYEALEAMAKIITKSDADLSKNRERFVKVLAASREYKDLMREQLKQYIDYGNRFRHAASQGQPKPAVSIREVESFIYQTGSFLRLAMPNQSEN